MNDTLIVIACIAGAIVAAMLFTSWRIRRLQYPPHLRWPKEKEKRKTEREHREDRPEDQPD